MSQAPIQAGNFVDFPFPRLLSARMWFNHSMKMRTPEQRKGALHLTVHSMDELLAWFSNEQP